MEKRIVENYEKAKEVYLKHGIDVDRAIETLAKIPVSMNCRQGDDIGGFEKNDFGVSGGIQATGNYPGKARNEEELMADIKKALELIPGTKRINLHATYGHFEENVDRDQIKPEHFDKWIEFGKENNVNLDFNATFFSHPRSEFGTLASPIEEDRKFWIEHGIRCLEISEYIAEKMGDKVLYDIWIPDGLKEEPADRMGPRIRLKDSLDQILAHGYDREKVDLALEQKVFGIGVESYTVGSHEFYMQYASKNDLLCLIDVGHFHPTENVADKLSSLALFSDKIALHLTRPVRWDSDHVVRFNDDMREVCQEIVKIGYEKFAIGVDYFDASINRVAAWVIGMRNVQKSLLLGLLRPNEILTKYQDELDFTRMFAVSEDIKTLPFADVWNYYCAKSGVKQDFEWIEEVEKYEKEVLSKRG
jgi:L-rhamnose isomerase